MPRPKKSEQDGKEVKKRSRNGCWPCKSRKVKCGEEKPSCVNCQRQGEVCDYSIRLNWDGRSKKKDDGKQGSQVISFESSPAQYISPPQHQPQSQPHHQLLPQTRPSSSPPGPIHANGFANLNGAHDQSMSPQTSLNGQQTHLGYRIDQLAPDTALPLASDFKSNGNSHVAGFNPTILPPPPVLRTPQWGERTSMSSNQDSQPIPTLRQSLSLPAYPSPSESGFGSPGMANTMYQFTGTMQMPPPMPTSNPNTRQESTPSPYNGTKRLKMSPRTDNFGRSSYPRAGSYGPNEPDEPLRVQFNTSNPTFFPSYLNLSNPLTPATSAASQISQDNDDRRISVSSLLSEDPEPDESQPLVQADYNGNLDEPIPRRGSLHQRMISYSETETYGQDRGNADLDVPRNNDTMAISGMSPSEHSDFETWLNDTDLGVPEFGFGLSSRETAFQGGGYYAAPVAIKIPRKLEPLPRTLSENPMNLLYFHHFLNHTARILVPHDCPENPFKTILPKMAMENPNLLNLLLAYSACHRARSLGHPEPVNRIAIWVRDVFPSLRQTLDDVSSTTVSNANLATAIMLASIEIISPSTFGVSIPWQDHLGMARSIIRARGGPHSVSRKDPVMYFLTRWLAYLDVLGSLSGRRNEEPLFAGNYWSSSHEESTSAKELSLTDEDEAEDDDFTIDCLLGFTTRCVSILAQVALLARECEAERIDFQTGQIDESWRPSAEVARKAAKLRKDLEHARNHEQISCLHHSPQLSKATMANSRRGSAYADMSKTEAEESLATNSAFHWAGMIHLLRRVDNLPRHDERVQAAVHEIVKVLQMIREGGSAQACLLFPMFTAGVEAEDALDRAEILSRIRGAEGLGMCQVSRARKIMEEVWRTGVSWECLVTGEFFG